MKIILFYTITPTLFYGQLLSIFAGVVISVAQLMFQIWSVKYEHEFKYFWTKKGVSFFIKKRFLETLQNLLWAGSYRGFDCFGKLEQQTKFFVLKITKYLFIIRYRNSLLLCYSYIFFIATPSQAKLITMLFMNARGMSGIYKIVLKSTCYYFFLRYISIRVLDNIVTTIS